MYLLNRLLALHQIINSAGISGLSWLPECADSRTQTLVDPAVLEALSKTAPDDFAHVHCGVFPLSLLCRSNLEDQLNQSEIITQDGSWGDLVLRSGFNQFLFSYFSLWRKASRLHPSIATIYSGLPLSVTTALADSCDRLTIQVLIHKYPQTIMLSGTNIRLYRERRDFTNIAFIDHANNIQQRKSQRAIRKSRLLLAERMMMPNLSTETRIYQDESPEVVCEYLAGFGLGYRSIANLCMYAGFLAYDDACRTASRYVSSRQDQSLHRTIWSALSICDQDRVLNFVECSLSRVRHSPTAVCRAFPAACLQAAAILELPCDPELFVGLMRSIATAMRKRDGRPTP